MPYDFTEVPVGQGEHRALDEARAQGRLAPGDKTQQVVGVYGDTRRTQVTEQWAKLTYTGVGDSQTLRQLWNRCPPPGGPEPLQTVTGTVPSAHQAVPPPDREAPNGKKSSRNGKLFMKGYKVEGYLYIRRYLLEEKTVDGGATWTRSREDWDVRWYKARVDLEDHQVPLIEWEPWRPVECRFGLGESFGMVIPEGEFYVLARLEGEGLVEGKPLQVASATVSLNPIAGLTLARSPAVRYSLTGDRLELVFLDQDEAERVLGRIEIRAAEGTPIARKGPNERA